MEDINNVNNKVIIKIGKIKIRIFLQFGILNFKKE